MALSLPVVRFKIMYQASICAPSTEYQSTWLFFIDLHVDIPGFSGVYPQWPKFTRAKSSDPTLNFDLGVIKPMDYMAKISIKHFDGSIFIVVAVDRHAPTPDSGTRSSKSILKYICRPFNEQRSPSRFRLSTELIVSIPSS